MLRLRVSERQQSTPKRAPVLIATDYRFPEQVTLLQPATTTVLPLAPDLRDGR